jgi:hypothetical protein
MMHTYLSCGIDHSDSLCVSMWVVTGGSCVVEARNGRVTAPESSADILGVDLHVFTNTCMQYVNVVTHVNVISGFVILNWLTRVTCIVSGVRT